MRALLFTTGSPFARAVRIILDELGLDYQRREESYSPKWCLAPESSGDQIDLSYLNTVFELYSSYHLGQVVEAA